MSKESEETKNVKCADCGLLGVRRRADCELIEATEEFRTDGKIAGQVIDKRPLCTARVVNLGKDVSQSISLSGQESNNEPDHILKIINKDRQCKAFQQWEQGFTPKEHIEMTHLQKLQELVDIKEKENRLWLVRMARRERRWRNEDKTNDETRRREDLNRERLKGWTVAAWTIAASVITWALTIVAISLTK